MAIFDAGLLNGFQDDILYGFDADGVKVLLVRRGEEVFALEDQCTHEALPLSEGQLEGDVLCCAFHGARFDLKSGAALSLPAYEAVRVFPVRVEHGRVLVEIE